MNIAYFGSPELSARLLDVLHKHDDLRVKLVLTQPDKPAGKHLHLTPTNVKTYAINASLPVFDKEIGQTEQQEIQDLFKRYNIDLCIVLAYGSIISGKLLTAVPYGYWNIHPSLLPKYRGASPTTYPIALGDNKTGVTLMYMNEKMDEGNIIDQQKILIDNHTTRFDIEDKVIPLASDMIIHTVNTLKANKILTKRPQNHAQATYTRRIQKQDGYIPIDFLREALQKNQSSINTPMSQLISSFYKENTNTIIPSLPPGQIIWNIYRALVGWPGIWTRITTSHGEKRLLLKKVSFEYGVLKLESVQLEGKNEVKYIEFCKSYSIFT